jgi:hypothetical protein
LGPSGAAYAEINQGRARKITGGADGLSKFGRAQGRRPKIQQLASEKTWRNCCDIADCYVRLSCGQIDQAGVRVDAQRQLRMQSLEAGEPGNKPDICKERQGGDTQMRNPRLASCLLQGRIHFAERPGQPLAQRLPERGEADLPDLPYEEGRADPLLERAHLMTDSRWGQAQIKARVTKTLTPGRQNKGAQSCSAGSITLHK